LSSLILLFGLTKNDNNKKETVKENKRFAWKRKELETEVEKNNKGDRPLGSSNPQRNHNEHERRNE
jgi:hypothetical protein